MRWPILALGLFCAGGGLYAIGLYRDAHPAGEVARLSALLSLKSGMSVAEIGAGDGRRTFFMARQMGPLGQVYATELEQARVEAIRDTAKAAGVPEVAALRGSERETNLPAECCDAIFMSKVYHHFSRPASMNASLFAALRPGGRLGIIDFEPRFWRFWLSTPDGVPDNRRGHGMPLKILIEELTDAGFEIEHVEEAWWSWPEERYCVVVRKPS